MLRRGFKNYSLLITLFLSGCQPFSAPPAVNRSGITSDAAMVGKTYVYRDNPIILSGSKTLGVPNMGKFLDFQNPEPIASDNATLTDDCTYDSFYIRPDCIRVLEDKTPGATPISSNQGAWVFKANTPEFYQAQGMYQAKFATARFQSALKFIEQNGINSNLSGIFPYSTVPFSIANRQSFWFNFVSSLSNDQKTNQLTVYAGCSIEGNAFFLPADVEVCLGIDSSIPGFRMIQDPTILYHEMGHAFVKLMMNLRNNDTMANPEPYTTNLGQVFYDEAGSINEAIADYFSYVMTARPHFGEWGAGRFYGASRPLLEDDDIHAVGISSAIDERLSYPDYLHYDVAAPETVIEDVHYAGQIASHFLTRLTEELKQSSSGTCANNHEVATNYVILAMSETLSSIGDLSAEGSDQSPLNLYNINSDQSYLWAFVKNPATYRRFFQLFAKNVKQHIINSACSNSYTVQNLEQLLDSYGLLLFKHYDDNLSAANHAFNSLRKFPYYPVTIITTPYAPTAIDENNRLKSVLVQKSLVGIESDPTKSIAIVIDDKSRMNTILANLMFEGKVISPTQGLASTNFNNANVKISPGEVLGIILNMENNSNSKVGGVRILATPWDHMKVINTTTGATKPCQIGNWPLTSEGGQSDTLPAFLTAAQMIAWSANAPSGCNINSFGVSIPSTISNTCREYILSQIPGNCEYVSREANEYKPSPVLYPEDALHPVCVVQKSENNETRWISQDEFRQSTQLLLQNQDCLGNGSTDFNPNECLMRFLPGAQQAWMSKIDPQKTYGETLKGNATEAPVYNTSSLLVMEVNKWVPPGTIFNCRLRMQFSNCSDCYENYLSPTNPKDDFRDFEYAGHRPFRVLNFQFTVID